MDVGSNALRLAIAEFKSPTQYEILERVRAPVRLGESVFKTQRIDPATMEAALDAFRSFRRKMEQHGVVVHRAVATSATREAKNRAAFLERVRSETGLDLELIQGTEEARFTDARAGDYFFNGSIQHLSHVILDLAKWYDETYSERVQYMFRSNPAPAASNADEFTDGGGPTFIESKFAGRQDALDNARGIGTSEKKHRMGHLTALHRSSRTSAGTPLHIRMDGPGFDSIDVPDGSSQPKLRFTSFVPTAEFFAVMRRNQAALDLVQKHGVEDDDNGLERFLTATRRQNFLVPPRERRAFPLLELA